MKPAIEDCKAYLAGRAFSRGKRKKGATRRSQTKLRSNHTKPYVRHNLLIDLLLALQQWPDTILSSTSRTSCRTRTARTCCSACEFARARVPTACACR